MFVKKKKYREKPFRIILHRINFTHKTLAEFHNVKSYENDSKINKYIKLKFAIYSDTLHSTSFINPQFVNYYS